MPLSPRDARVAGSEAVAVFRRSLSEKLAELVRRDPERAEAAMEVGLIDRRWLEDPSARRVSTATPFEVIERFLERTVEQHPSTLGSLGLGAVQVLAFGGDSDEGGAAQPVTVVFTDLEDFTPYTATEGDEAAVTLLRDHHRAVSPVVRSRGGRVVKRLGDGLMLSFPEPEAAVLAALELLETSPAPLRLRAGIHCGEALVSRDDVVGHMVNVAARVTEAARGDQVLATTDVRDAVGDLRGVVFSKPHKAHLKGLAAPVSTCRVTRAPS